MRELILADVRFMELPDTISLHLLDFRDDIIALSPVVGIPLGIFIGLSVLNIGIFEMFSTSPPHMTRRKASLAAVTAAVTSSITTAAIAYWCVAS